MSMTPAAIDERAARDLALVTKLATRMDDAPRPVIALTLREFLSRQLPPRETLLDPWLTSQSLSMIYAWRGTGKTHVALGIAYALASGGTFLKWTAAHPTPVLYVDGEMPGESLQKRLAAIVASSDKQDDGDLLRIVTPDTQPDGVMPNLAEREGQSAIEAQIGNSRVIILDNISCLVRGMARENDAESWAPVAGWALRQRAHGRAVVFIHHSGKGGAQRGTSKREDALDTVIALRRPPDYNESEGARFEIHFEKYRNYHDAHAADPIEARLETDANGRQTWTMKDAIGALHERIIELADLGMKQGEIAQELSVNKSTVFRHLRDAEANGEVRRAKSRGLE